MDDGQGFFLKMMRLHRWLLDEYKRDGSFSWGKSIVGYANFGLGDYYYKWNRNLVSS
mgnify:CR=1 FL=1